MSLQLREVEHLVEQLRQRPARAGALDRVKDRARAAFREAAARRDQAADSAGQPVGMSVERRVSDLEPGTGRGEIAVFQANEREREGRCGIRLPGPVVTDHSRPSPAISSAAFRRPRRASVSARYPRQAASSLRRACSSAARVEALDHVLEQACCPGEKVRGYAGIA